MSKNSIAEQPLVLALPGMNEIRVQRDVVYARGQSCDLTLDLYRPPGAAPALPAVILVTGYPDAEGQLKLMTSSNDWARLIACCGMIAVAYANENPVRDVEALLEHITTQAVTYGIDASRLGVWSCSGNVPNALALLERRNDVRCAALCYGYMTVLPGDDGMANAAEQFGFVIPRPDVHAARLAHTPLLVARAGRDDMAGLNASLDYFVSKALARNLPLTLLNLPDSPHGFDLFDASRASREAIRQILAFLQAHLLPDDSLLAPP